MKKQPLDAYDELQQLYVRYLTRTATLGGLGLSAVFYGNSVELRPVIVSGLFGMAGGIINLMAAADISSLQERIIIETVEEIETYENPK